MTRQLHVVNGRNTHPGFGASLEGWAACDAGVPWNSSAEELMEREELHPSIEALLRAVGEDGEFVARINPDAELPSSRRLHTKQGMPSPQPLLELSAQPNPNARHSSPACAGVSDAMRPSLLPETPSAHAPQPGSGEATEAAHAP